MTADLPPGSVWSAVAPGLPVCCDLDASLRFWYGRNGFAMAYVASQEAAMRARVVTRLDVRDPA